AALRELAGAAGELAQLRRLHGDGPTPVNPPDGAPPPELAANLARLEARIATLRQVAAGGPHTGERHFIDG
ncbi:MAG TPA: hypothetical protein VGI06_14560, partial [Acidimicrobiales bacterium]